MEEKRLSSLCGCGATSSICFPAWDPILSYQQEAKPVIRAWSTSRRLSMASSSNQGGRQSSNRTKREPTSSTYLRYVNANAETVQGFLSRIFKGCPLGIGGSARTPEALKPTRGDVFTDRFLLLVLRSLSIYCFLISRRR